MPVYFRIELEFGNVGFKERGKPEYPEKTSRVEHQQQINPHLTLPAF